MNEKTRMKANELYQSIGSLKTTIETCEKGLEYLTVEYPDQQTTRIEFRTKNSNGTHRFNRTNVIILLTLELAELRQELVRLETEYKAL